MNERDGRHDLTKLRLLAAQDALEMSADEMAQEDVKAGVDTEAEAARLQSAMRQTAARVAREAQPACNRDYVPLSGRVRNRPDFEGLKAKVREVFAARPQLGLAYRDGRHQTDEEWQSLYDDLVDLGAIEPDEHED